MPGNFSTNLIVNLSKTGLLRAYFAQLARSENSSIAPLVPRALHDCRPRTATISRYTNGRNKRSSRGVQGTTLLSSKGESSVLLNFSSFPDIFANSNTASRTYQFLSSMYCLEKKSNMIYVSFTSLYQFLSFLKFLTISKIPGIFVRRNNLDVSICLKIYYFNTPKFCFLFSAKSSSLLLSIRSVSWFKSLRKLGKSELCDYSSKFLQLLLYSLISFSSSPIFMLRFVSPKRAVA